MILPLVGGKIPATKLMTVVFPAPFGPMIPKISPLLIEKVRSFTANKPPNRLSRPSVSNTGTVDTSNIRFAGKPLHDGSCDPLWHEQDDKDNDYSIHNEVTIGHDQLQIL